MQSFHFENPKAIYDAAFVEIDIAEWLETETIQDPVGFSAVDQDGADATAEVLDLVRSGFSGSRLLPYIKGGVDRVRYTVLCQVDTLEGNHQEFRITFSVREAP